MTDNDHQKSRRRILQLAGSGSVLGLAGCLETGAPADITEDRAPDWCVDELGLDESVPDVEANALSLDGMSRKAPADLASKEEVDYQCGATDGNHCGTCTFYISDRNGDAVGACTEVEGGIRSVDWCAIWTAKEKVRE